MDKLLLNDRKGEKIVPKEIKSKKEKIMWLRRKFILNSSFMYFSFAKTKAKFQLFLHIFYMFSKKVKKINIKKVKLSF